MRTEATFDAREFRDVLGQLPTGVAVICAETPDGPAGLSCNSITSVSLDPPMVLVCPAKTSTTWPSIRQSGRFCVSLLARDHAEVCQSFSRRGVDRFAGVATHSRRHGPALDDALAWLDCSIHAEHDAGDHVITVARVDGLEQNRPLDPLIFFRGAYGTFMPDSACDPGSGRHDPGSKAPPTSSSSSMG